MAKWRETVKSSIENEEPMYVRDTVYDRLLDLLFPEMRSALNNSFGTPLQILEKDYDTTEDLPEPPPARFVTSNDAFLRGKAFSEWAQRYPEAAKAWLNSPAGKNHQEQRRGQSRDGSQQYGQWKRKHT